MSAEKEEVISYTRPVRIAKGIYWIGFHDVESGLHCNPYIIIEEEEAVVIDGGSRPDFPSVMMKILSTGIDPSRICALIYQHFDPDLCGSVPHFEDIIDRPDLKIITCKSNHMFVRHYGVSSKLYSLSDFNFVFRFRSGRELCFMRIPYAHAEGSFVTLDRETGVLFSSDLFGSYGASWELFLSLSSKCADCTDYDNCPEQKPYCPFPDIAAFHQYLIPSERILKYALEQIAKLSFSTIAPQHGSVIRGKRDVEVVWNKLAALKDVGIDQILQERTEFDLKLRFEETSQTE